MKMDCVRILCPKSALRHSKIFTVLLTLIGRDIMIWWLLPNTWPPWNYVKFYFVRLDLAVTAETFRSGHDLLGQWLTHDPVSSVVNLLMLVSITAINFFGQGLCKGSPTQVLCLPVKAFEVVRLGILFNFLALNGFLKKVMTTCHLNFRVKVIK